MIRMCHSKTVHQSVIVLATLATSVWIFDGVPSTAYCSFLLLLLFFVENQSWHHMWINSLVDDSHEMIRLIFYEKLKTRNVLIWHICPSPGAILTRTQAFFKKKKKKKWRNLPINNPKPDLHNINAHTEFGENPLTFTQVIVQETKIRMDRQT